MCHTKEQVVVAPYLVIKYCHRWQAIRIQTAAGICIQGDGNLPEVEDAGHDVDLLWMVVSINVQHILIPKWQLALADTSSTPSYHQMFWGSTVSVHSSTLQYMPNGMPAEAKW